MIERKIIKLKKDELRTKEFIKRHIGKGKLSSIKIERTPMGERIIIVTSKPGAIIGRKGENITELTDTLKKKFGLQNPKLEILEVERPEFDAQNIADQIAMSLENFGTQSFKIVCYKFLERIKQAGALGGEFVLSGKLPGEKARSWRFAFGYLKKTGDTANLVNKAQAVSHTKPGVTGIQVAILPGGTKIPDRIVVPTNEEAIIVEEIK
jgi:small subunit ribosomal protein S3